MIKKLQKLNREKEIIYVRDYSNNKLAEVEKVETTTGQICLIIN
ncbi:MAG: hypothetical protein ACFFG0_30815 [Candidatus Thorarchaeota archaeon]